MSVAFLHPFVSSLMTYLHGKSTNAGVMGYGMAIGTIGQIPPVVLLWYVLGRRGQGFRDIGLRWSWRDCGMGVLLTIAAFFLTVAGSAMIRFVMYELDLGETARQAAQSAAHFWGRGTFWSPWGLLYLTTTPFYEEILVRAYLMTELIEMTGSTALAVVVSTLLQASYHLYYGWSGVASVAFVFVVFALYFAKARRALPCITAHWYFDLLATLFAR